MDAKIKKSALRRLRIIEGQVRGLQKMVSDEKYCVDIITQASAVARALSSVEDIVLQNHLSTHVIEQIRAGNEPKAIKEILAVYALSKRK
jgi:CsoR family transcriptional regulator, copper-sensing transcriptional repressor